MQEKLMYLKRNLSKIPYKFNTKQDKKQERKI